MARRRWLKWLSDLRDSAARARIVARLDRLKAGLRGDWKSVGEGVCELRIDYGPGYRVYYAQDGDALIILLCGGDKRSQAKGYRTSSCVLERLQGPQAQAARSERRITCKARPRSPPTLKRCSRMVMHAPCPSLFAP